MRAVARFLGMRRQCLGSGATLYRMDVKLNGETVYL